MLRHRASAAVGAWLAVSSLTFPALAHGPAAAVTGLAASDDAGARVVTLSEGLGIRLDGEWRWVCYGEFGTELAPPALSVDGERTYVVGTNDLFVLESDGGVTPQNRPDLSRETVLSLVALEGRLYVLRLLAGGGSDVVPLDAPDAGAIWQGAASNALTADVDSLWVARIEGTAGYAIRLTPDGTVQDSQTFLTDPGDRIVQVQRIGGVIYATVTTAAAGGKLLRIDNGDAGEDAGDAGGHTVVLSSETPIVGPVSAGGMAWAEANELLQVVTPDAVMPYSTGYPITCVGNYGASAFLCAQTLLISLDPEGPGPGIFSLNDIMGPSQDPALTDAGTCNGEWDLFRYSGGGEFGAGGDADVGTPVTSPGPGHSGCALAHGQDQGRWGALALAGVLVARWSLRRGAGRRQRSGDA